ncbi:protein-export chaperone SecB [Rickettsiales bacterium]|nr:protein-export chaperone SecB [Rickettsiales bacterium]
MSSAKSTGMPALKLVNQYVKSLLFTSKIMPTEAIFESTKDADVSTDINIDAVHFKENSYEVSLSIRCVASVKDHEICEIDVVYAGVFEVVDIDSDDLEMVLLIYCPGVIYPFAREVVANSVMRAGLPPLMLELVDFSQIYYDSIEEDN